MMTAWFFTGVSLFALLIVDICCIPVNKGFNPSAYTNAAPNFGSKQGAPGVVMPYTAPSKGVSTPSYQPVPHLQPSFSQPAVQRQPAAPVGFTQPGTAFQPGLKDINWAVAPPSLSSGGEEMSTGTHGIGSSRPENVSPPLPPPGPMYQAGELSHYETNVETGDYQTETEEQGYLPPHLPPPPPPPPHPMPDSAEKGCPRQPQPEFSMGRSWGAYPYYDVMFLTGQYPPGTVSHSSSSYEQGSDGWQDVHYIRDYYNPGPAQQIEPFTGDSAAPQSFEDPRQPVKNPVMAGYGQGGAQAGLPASSHGGFMQPRLDTKW